MSLSEARFSQTRLYAGEAERDGKYVHVIAYQNTAISEGPNAMVLPLPAAVMPGRENILDTRDCKDFLVAMEKATRRARRNAARGMDLAEVESAADVFDVGSYTVVLAARPQDVADALASVPEEKRPALNPEVLAAFDELYPGWPIAVCCWNGRIEAEPLLWWFEPMHPKWLFLPALDAHDGKAPDPEAPVSVDHFIAFGSTLEPLGDDVHYAEWRIPPAVRALLPPKVRGAKVERTLSNADVWRATGTFPGPALRCAPPGLPISSGLLGKLASSFGRGCPAKKKMEVPLDGWG
ncbi:MAG: hypothetical protein U0441_11480 [Polyangiaceae bacterium]